MSRDLEEIFPNLAATDWEEMSEETPRYNCIAWAAGDNTRKWDPSFLPRVMPGYYWPPGATEGLDFSSLKSAFRAIGYQDADGGDLEGGYDKVVLYKIADADGEWMAHAARQTGDGRWWSKLGDLRDIIHPTPEALVGDEYGVVGCYMKRPKPRPDQPARAQDD